MGFLSFFASLHWVPFLILDVVSASPGLILTLPLPEATWLQLSWVLQAQPEHIPSSTRQCPSSWSPCYPSCVHSSSPLPLSCRHAYHSILIACWRPSYPTVMLAPEAIGRCLVPWSIFSSYFKGLRWRTDKYLLNQWETNSFVKYFQYIKTLIYECGRQLIHCCCCRC